MADVISAPLMFTDPALGSGALPAPVPEEDTWHGLTEHAPIVVVAHAADPRVNETCREYDAPVSLPWIGLSLMTVNDPEPAVSSEDAAPPESGLGPEMSSTDLPPQPA